MSDERARTDHPGTRPTTTLALGGELTIASAAETVSRLAAALDAAPAALHLDLLAVTELDTAGLQVLIWTAREGAGRGVPVAVEPSDVVAGVLTSVGLDVTSLSTAGTR